MTLSRKSCLEIGTADLGSWEWEWGREWEYRPSLKLTVEIGQLHTNFEACYELPGVLPAILSEM